MKASGVDACVVSVGNELLFGQTVDTNSAWMGRALATRGIPVLRRYVVSDTPAEIGAAVAEAIAVADLVIVSGGLGPTEDDVTREVVAELLGAPLEVDEVLLGALRERFRARGYEQMPASNVSQAEVPRGAQVLANPHGTAPGLLMRGDSAVVVLLPGVPRELRGIFEGALGDVLEDTFAGRAVPVWHRMVHTTGIAESRLAELVQEALDREPSVGGEDGNVSVAYLPDLRGVDLRITARSVEEEQATARLQRVVERIVSVLGPWTFAARSGDIVEAVSGRLRARGLKLATAESCTAGLIA